MAKRKASKCRKINVKGRGCRKICWGKKGKIVSNTKCSRKKSRKGKRR